jgi:hypothetical protein
MNGTRQAGNVNRKKFPIENLPGKRISLMLIVKLTIRKITENSRWKKYEGLFFITYAFCEGLCQTISQINALAYKVQNKRVSKIKDKRSQSSEKCILEKGVSSIVYDCSNTQRVACFLPTPAFSWKNNAIAVPDVSDSGASPR